MSNVHLGAKPHHMTTDSALMCSHSGCKYTPPPKQPQTLWSHIGATHECPSTCAACFFVAMARDPPRHLAVAADAKTFEAELSLAGGMRHVLEAASENKSLRENLQKLIDEHAPKKTTTHEKPTTTTAATSPKRQKK